MRKNILNKVLVAGIILTMFGCKAKKRLVEVNRPVADSALVKTDSSTTDNSKNEKLAAIKTSQINFNTFSGKARTHLEIDGKGYDVTMNIRIQKGKKIWVSITAFVGYELARVLITPDSIKIINKFQSVYLKKPFSYVYQYGGRQINYQTVEAIMVGNAVPEFINTNATLAESGSNTIISGILSDLAYQTTFGTDLKVSSLKLTNTKATQKLDVNNSEFIQADNRVLPSAISINSYQNGLKADLHYIKAEFDRQLDTPFNEPNGYTLIN